MGVVGDDAALRSGEAHGRDIPLLEGHGEKRHGDPLAGGEQHVELASRRASGHLAREREQFVCGVAHGGDHDDDVVTGGLCRGDAFGDDADFLGVGDRRAAEFLDDESHRSCVAPSKVNFAPGMLSSVGPMSETASRAPGTWESLRATTGSWRLLSVSLLSFSSGLPLGLVWLAIPAWMTRAGFDIKVVGLFALTQVPWSFKPLWAPLLDRYAPPVLGPKRGWILLGQIALLLCGLGFASAARNPVDLVTVASISLLTAFASATHDIAYDGYAVEVLRPEEHGFAVGARTALYRGGMLVSGGLSITLAGSFDMSFLGRNLHWEGSWATVHVILALVYLPLMLVTWFAPEPESKVVRPASLGEAVWRPFVGFLRQHRALEILAFVVLYKLSDNLTQALTRPFLMKVGFDDFDVGIATATVGQVAVIAGTFAGGLLSNRLGLGRSLWIFGALQLISNLGYAAVAQIGMNRPLMYAAQAFELGASGLGAGAFGVLLLRMTERRFSATQYALLSSLASLPRVAAGPVAGILADLLGWRDFFVLTVLFGVPGLVLLARFVPWSARDLAFRVEEGRTAGGRARWTSVVAGGLTGFLVAGATGVLGLATVAALSAWKVHGEAGLRLAESVGRIASPGTPAEAMTTGGIVAFAVFVGLVVAGVRAVRGGNSGPHAGE